jgi:hypothetical protein
MCCYSLHVVWASISTLVAACATSTIGWWVEKKVIYTDVEVIILGSWTWRWTHFGLADKGVT